MDNPSMMCSWCCMFLIPLIAYLPIANSVDSGWLWALGVLLPLACPALFIIMIVRQIIREAHARLIFFAGSIANLP